MRETSSERVKQSPDVKGLVCHKELCSFYCLKYVTFILQRLVSLLELCVLNFARDSSLSGMRRMPLPGCPQDHFCLRLVCHSSVAQA